MNKLIFSFLMIISFSAFGFEKNIQKINNYCHNRSMQGFDECYLKKTPCYRTCEAYAKKLYSQCVKNNKKMRDICIINHHPDLRSMTFEQFQAYEAKEMHTAANFNT